MTWGRVGRLAERWPPRTTSNAPGRPSASTPEPKGGARCVERARWDLRGRRPATTVATAIAQLRRHINLTPRAHGGPRSDSWNGWLSQGASPRDRARLRIAPMARRDVPARFAHTGGGIG